MFADCLRDVKRMVANVESLTRDKRRDKIYEWLSPPDPSTNYKASIEKRYEGTGRWFLESNQFMEWKLGSQQFLWLHGIPGCGKTILSSTIVEHLRSSQEDSPPVVLDFYFDFTVTDKQSLESVICSLIAQLCDQNEHAWGRLEQLFTSCKDGKDRPTTQSLRTTLHAMIETFNAIRVVLDALDECQTRKELLPWIREFVTSSKNVDIIVTSRKEEDIESALIRWMRADAIVPIQRGPVNEDIFAYVHNRVRTDKGLDRWQAYPKVQDEIQTKVMEKADGMYVIKAPLTLVCSAKAVLI